MKGFLQRIVLVMALILAAQISAYGQTGYIDLPVNSAKDVVTTGGVNLHSSFGGKDEFFAVFKIWPVTPGKRYEATLTFDAGNDMSYGTTWVDGDPGSRDFGSFVGIGTGTGTKEMKQKQEKFLFSIDPASTSNVLYVSLRSRGPWKLRFGVTDRLSGATPQSQDRWGYYYVRDFDADKNAPFLLKRGGMAAAPGAAAPAGGCRIVGPYAFNAVGLQGTFRFCRVSDTEGVIWLTPHGAGTTELLSASIAGDTVKFFRILDCRNGVSPAYRQVFTGRMTPDGIASGSYFNENNPSLIYPWEVRKP